MGGIFQILEQVRTDPDGYGIFCKGKAHLSKEGKKEIKGMHATNEAGWQNPNIFNHEKHPANKSQTGWSMFVHVSKSHHSGGQSVFHVRPISLSTSQGLNMSMSLFVQLPQVRQYPPRHCAVVFPIPFSTVVQTLFAASSNIGLGCT